MPMTTSNRSRSRARAAASAVAVLSLAACAGTGRAPAASAPPSPGPSGDASGWRPLFDGKTLAGWTVSNFPAHGEVRVEDGAIVLGMGEACTGVTWTGGPPSAGPKRGDLPRVGYEIALEAQRAEGSDFFCGLTFPVGDSHASFIVGGWGGPVVGISCIDGYDASDNETTRIRHFTRGRWYRFRVRVTAQKIEAWIDDEQVVDVSTEGRRISTRADIDECLPLGVASWRTTAWVRNVRMRKL